MFVTLLTTHLHGQAINNEEELLEWEMTAFPQIQMITNMKEPFDRLWHTAAHFHEQHDKWMNGKQLFYNVM